MAHGNACTQGVIMIFIVVSFIRILVFILFQYPYEKEENSTYYNVQSIRCNINIYFLV